MIRRIDYNRTNHAAVEAVASAYEHITSIDDRLRNLIEVRVSQINGCVYCVDLHTKKARAAGEEQRRLDALPVWYESPLFGDAERAALAWAEALTHVAETRAPDDVYEGLRRHYSDQQIVDLTLIVSIMNAWNRLSIGMRRVPDDQQPQG